MKQIAYRGPEAADPRFHDGALGEDVSAYEALYERQADREARSAGLEEIRDRRLP